MSSRMAIFMKGIVPQELKGACLQAVGLYGLSQLVADDGSIECSSNWCPGWCAVLALRRLAILSLWRLLAVGGLALRGLAIGSLALRGLAVLSLWWLAIGGLALRGLAILALRGLPVLPLRGLAVLSLWRLACWSLAVMRLAMLTLRGLTILSLRGLPVLALGWLTIRGLALQEKHVFLSTFGAHIGALDAEVWVTKLRRMGVAVGRLKATAAVSSVVDVVGDCLWWCPVGRSTLRGIAGRRGSGKGRSCRVSACSFWQCRCQRRDVNIRRTSDSEARAVQ